MNINNTVNSALYTVQTYAEEMKLIKDLPGGKRGAAVTAAKKRLRLGIVLRWLHKVTDEHDLDMTPSMASHIVKGWIDRGVSNRQLIEQFATPNRTASNKSRDFERIDEIINRYRPHVIEEIATEFHAVHLLSSDQSIYK